MSDFLDKLRDYPSAVARKPEATVVYARASRIRHRRATTQGAATVVALIVGVIAATQTPFTQPERSVGSETSSRGSSSLRDETEKINGSRDNSGAQRGDAAANNPAVVGGPAVSKESDDGSKSTNSPIVVSVVVLSQAGVRPVDFEVKACNNSDRPTKHDFNSSQRFDVVVYPEGKTEAVWRWSTDQAFALVLGSEEFGAGECRTETMQWSAASDPEGSYYAVGVLTDSTRPTSNRTTFKINPR